MKVIASGTALAIRQYWDISQFEIGFQEETGTETTIVMHVANVISMKLTAVLDLTLAYVLVTRQKLYKIVSASQGWNIL